MMSKVINKVIRLLSVLKSPKIIPVITPIDKDLVLSGQVAFVTGGSSGIGLAIAESFLKSGCKVVIAGTKREKLEAAKRSVNSDNLGTIVMDVKDVCSIPCKIEEAVALFGNISIWVNSAGAHNVHEFEDMTEEEFDNILDTNLKGTFFLCQAAIRYMKKNKIHGHILNISSSSSLRPAEGPYQMSKWAINGLTKGIARRFFRDGIIVNAIAPGQTATPMLDVDKNGNISNAYAFAGRYSMPEEIATLATLMVSRMGDMIVGDTYYITGGSGTVTFDG